MGLPARPLCPSRFVPPVAFRWPTVRVFDHLTEASRLLVITLLLLSSVPAYREWVQVAGNDQAGIAVAQLNRTPVRDYKPAAVVPVPRTESWWTTQHEDTVKRIRQGEVDLLMIGDSITQGWADESRRIWDTYYGRRRAVNLGVNGDGTEHVLWRLDHGEIEGIAPKLVVVMIGTINTVRVRIPQRRPPQASRRFSLPCTHTCQAPRFCCSACFPAVPQQITCSAG